MFSRVRFQLQADIGSESFVLKVDCMKEHKFFSTIGGCSLENFTDFFKWLIDKLTRIRFFSIWNHISIFLWILHISFVQLSLLKLYLKAFVLYKSVQICNDYQVTKFSQTLTKIKFNQRKIKSSQMKHRNKDQCKSTFLYATLFIFY